MMSDFEDKTLRQGEPVDHARRRLLRLGGAGAAGFALSLFLPPALLWAATEKKAAGTAPVPSTKPRAPRLLMLDPGHGGHDPGAIGLSGTQEKDITLDIARRLRSAFSGEAGVKVMLTRERDVFLPLAERVKIGQEASADLFISIHADSAPDHSAKGLSVYSLSEKASDQFASQLAERENHADIIGGLGAPVEDKEVAAILFDLTARHTRNTAQRVKVGFIKGMGRRWTLLEQPMRSANFAVLRSPDVPSLLIETGFLSNKQDEALLKKPLQRQKIATLMAKELAFLLKSPLFG